MGFSPETYAVARKYTDDTVAGAGAVAGKPCQIQSITDITGGHRVTFLWVDNSSVSHTSTMDVMDGEKGDDGLGIKSVAVNSSNHLIVTYDDDTTEDAGEITLDTSDFVQKSSTAGLLKNDGTVDTTDYTVVSYTQTYSQSGQKIGEITIDGTTTDVVAPTGGGSEHGIPSGGTSGQILSKKSGTDYDVQWTDAGTASQEQADWNEADSSKVDYIKNKPNNLVQDANYVHTDYNYDATAKGIVDGIPLTIQQLQGSLLTKVDKVTGKGLSTNDYDATAKGIVDSIPLTITQLQGSLLEKFPRSEQRVLGAKNLWDLDNSFSPSESGSYTVNSGTLTINMTATQNSGIWMSGSQVLNPRYANYAGVSGKLSFDYKGDGSFKAKIGFYDADDGNQRQYDITTDWQHYECPVDIVNLAVWHGSILFYNCSGAVHTLQIKNIMLRLASDPDNTYAPPAMTNRELTEAVSNIPTVTVTHTGTASSTTARKQQITVNNVAYDVDGSVYMEQEVILSTSAATTVTFTNASITANSVIEFGCSKWGIVPDDIAASSGSCVVTLPKVSTSETVTVRIYLR